MLVFVDFRVKSIINMIMKSLESCNLLIADWDLAPNAIDMNGW